MVGGAAEHPCVFTSEPFSITFICIHLEICDYLQGKASLKLQQSPYFLMLLWELILNQALTSSKHPDIHHNMPETNCTEKTEEVVLWEVSICLDRFLWRLRQLRECYQCFGQDTVVTIVGEPQWLALILRAAVQTTSALIRLIGGTRRFPWESGAAVPWLSNTQSKPGELQLWCVGKSWVLCWVKLFPTSGLSV